jgi:hypothetical protein
VISREAQAIIDFVESTGLPYRVTDVNGPGHAPGSYHGAKGTGGLGLAVDFAGAIPGITPITMGQMAALYLAFLTVASQLAELIHAGPGITWAVKNGKRVAGAATFGPTVWADHRDHLHVAVPRGVFLTPLSHPTSTIEEEPMPPDDPNLPNLPDIAGFYPVINTTTGECTGYYILAKNGELHAFGPGAKWHGRSEVVER